MLLACAVLVYGIVSANACLAQAFSDSSFGQQEQLQELRRKANELRRQLNEKNQQKQFLKESAKLRLEIQRLQDSLNGLQGSKPVYSEVDSVNVHSIPSKLQEKRSKIIWPTQRYRHRHDLTNPQTNPTKSIRPKKQKNQVFKVVPGKVNRKHGALPNKHSQHLSQEQHFHQMPPNEFHMRPNQPRKRKKPQPVRKSQIIWPKAVYKKNHNTQPTQSPNLEHENPDQKTETSKSAFRVNPFKNLNVHKTEPSEHGLNTNTNVKTGSLGNAYGATVVGETPYYLISLEPEMEFGQFGIGLDVDLRLSNDGELREEDWRDINDALRNIKYVQYKSRSGKFSARVGALEHVTLGTGNLVYQYRNNSSRDDAKTGVQLSYKSDHIEIEAFTSNVAKFEIVAGRIELKPMSDAFQEILRSFHLGITYAGDFSNYANRYGQESDSTGSGFLINNAVSRGNFSGYAFDAALRVVHLPYLDLDMSVDATVLDGYGSGGSFGLNAVLRDARQELKLELCVQHIMQGDQYETGYFGSFYEVERVEFTDEENSWLETKANTLHQKTSDGNKYRTKLNLAYKQRFEFDVKFEKGYQNAPDGVLNTSLKIYNLLPQLNFETGYIKKNINSARNLSQFDENTLLTAQFELNLIKQLTLSMDYHWTFTPDEFRDNKVISYKTQEWVEPKANFRFMF